MFRLVNLQVGKIQVAKPALLPSLFSSSPADASSTSGRKNRGRCCRRSTIWTCIVRRRESIAFSSWILLGALFYTYDTSSVGGPLHGVEGLYQAITIGYSVGLSPRNVSYMPNPWFSTVYILIGASLIAVILTSLGRRVAQDASMHLFEDLKQRERYEKEFSRDNPFYVRLMAFVKYNRGYLLMIICWIVWMALIVIWSIIATRGTDDWGFAYAQYFAVSLCSSAGSFSLPSESPMWSYLLAAISMAIGVPLMALAISSIVIMCVQGHKFGQVKKAAWTPVTKMELETLMRIGLGHSEEVISKGDFVLLGMLRMGTEAGLIKYLCDAYDTAESERGCVCVENKKTLDRAPDSFYSEQARAYVATDEPDNLMSGGGAQRSGAFLSKNWPPSRRQVRLSPEDMSAALASFTTASSVSSAQSSSHPKQKKERWSTFASRDVNQSIRSELNVDYHLDNEDEVIDNVLLESGGLKTLDEISEDINQADTDEFCADQ